ncbi:hypothetical protein [Changpingibacter yushuensis]|uniref:hypothetical protein n=1 Tax=Changpingibacter yushuensis TaxID=2758440 RepID=UPI0015F62D9F|nr:hypothetical protein [Changpingibacter yushuensis]
MKILAQLGVFVVGVYGFRGIGSSIHLVKPQPTIPDSKQCDSSRRSSNRYQQHPSANGTSDVIIDAAHAHDRNLHAREFCYLARRPSSASTSTSQGDGIPRSIIG